MRPFTFATTTLLMLSTFTASHVISSDSTEGTDVAISSTVPFDSVMNDETRSMLGDAALFITTDTKPTTTANQKSPAESVLSVSSSLANETTVANITGPNDLITELSAADSCTCAILPGYDKICTQSCECCAGWGIETCCCFPQYNPYPPTVGAASGYCSSACCGK
ncbi:hypothetical protein CLAIMM_01757 [Cladophialophora immunda]|nr:hypothetical protein CLAIMM_01757 [Cladophialophora immunda]